MVSQETFTELFKQSITSLLEEVQKHVIEPLPQETYLTLEAFEQEGKELSIDEILLFLYQEGKFPRIVDLAVRGIREDSTIIWIRPSGHAYVDDFSQTWNTPTGTGPFKSIGLKLPWSIWRRPRPLSRQDLIEAGEQL